MQTEDFKIILTNRKAALMERMNDISDKFEKSGNEPHDGESPPVPALGTMQEKDDLAASEIRSIDAALARIAQGDFGECVTCGDDIDDARLNAVPHTPFCVAHAP